MKIVRKKHWIGLSLWLFCASVSANDHEILIEQAVGFDPDLSAVCERALEDAKRQARNRAGSVLYDHVVLRAREQNGRVQESMEKKTEIFSHVTAEILNTPVFEKSLVDEGQLAKCVARNVLVGLDTSQMDVAVQRFEQEQSTLSDNLKREQWLQQQLFVNDQSYQQMKRQAEGMKHWGYRFNRFCSNSVSKQLCLEEAKGFEEKRHQSRVAKSLDVPVEKVTVKMRSELQYEQTGEVTNGETLLFTGMAEYEVEVVNPYESENARYRQELAQLRREDWQTEQKPLDSGLEFDLGVTVFLNFGGLNQTSNAVGGGKYGIESAGDTYVAGRSLGFRLYPNNDYVGIYGALGSDDWHFCAPDNGVKCDVESQSLSFTEVGMTAKYGWVGADVGWVNYTSDLLLTEGYQAPDGYFKWNVFLGIRPKSGLGIGVNYGNRQISGGGVFQMKRINVFAVELSYGF